MQSLYRRNNSSQSQVHIAYDSGKYQAAIHLIKQLLKVYPKDPSLLTNMGSAEGELSNFIGSLYYYNKALDISPHHIGALVDIGLVFKKLGNNSATAATWKPKPFHI